MMLHIAVDYRGWSQCGQVHMERVHVYVVADNKGLVTRSGLHGTGRVNG